MEQKEYFTDEELICKCGCGLMNLSPRLRQKLNEAREIAGIPFVVRSACRCRRHNENIKGKPDSSHLLGLAADIETLDSSTRFLVLDALRIAGINRFDLGVDYIHADIDESKHPMVLGLGGILRKL